MIVLNSLVDAVPHADLAQLHVVLLAQPHRLLGKLSQLRWSWMFEKKIFSFNTNWFWKLKQVQSLPSWIGFNNHIKLNYHPLRHLIINFKEYSTFYLGAMTVGLHWWGGPSLEVKLLYWIFWIPMHYQAYHQNVWDHNNETSLFWGEGSDLWETRWSLLAF